MKTGSNLVELATKITAQKAAASDYIVDTRQVAMHEGRVEIPSESGQLVMVPTHHAHTQLATRLGVPTRFYDELGEKHSDLRDHMVTELLHRVPQRRMLRTLNQGTPTLRAYLSDRYRRFDNFQVAEAVLPVLGEVPDMQLQSCELTEQRMYLKAVFPRVQGEVQRGDVVQAGVVISNSEIGGGRTKVELMIYRLVCTNGMITAEGQRRNHVGRAIEGQDDESFELYSSATLDADERAFSMKLADSVRAFSADAGTFQKVLGQLQAAAGQPMTLAPVLAVEKLAQSLRLAETEQNSVLQHLLTAGDLSRWGLANAITRSAEDAQDYDRATELERLGGTLIEDGSMWSTVSKS